jgi:dephospho-CoA kinase
MERDELTQEEAQKKIKSQMPAEKKMKYADYIINTDGSINQTVEQAERIYRNFMIDYQLKYFA